VTFNEVLNQTIAMLQQHGRVSYRALKRQFDIHDDYIEDLKEAILYAYPQVVDDAGRGLIWTGEAETIPVPGPTPSQLSQPSETQLEQTIQVGTQPHTPDAERRQLTVMFCDLVGSTPLSEQLDPEDLREVVRAYQQTCAEVIQRFEGHIAQLLGDALLVYFGWPRAHEDDAQRAIRTGLGMLDAMGALNARLEQDKGIRLAIRIGLHTGLVVVGEMGGGGHQEQLALGDTPNVASRLHGLAAADTVVVSDTTVRLIEGYFTVEDLGPQALKGVATPMHIYRVLGASGVQSRLEAAAVRGLTPLVGREQEVGMLLERWVQAKEGRGQVVLLSGEAGIGKSRLVQVLTEHVAAEPHVRVAWRCSPYYQHSAFYPVIDHLQRLLRWRPEAAVEEKLRTLEATVAPYDLSLPDVVPLLAALLALPLPAHYPPLTLSPQRQKQKTLDTLLTWSLAEARRQPVLFIVEDLHWIDPSTLELLTLLISQVSTARILTLLACRPEFQPPWPQRAHITHLTLSRLPHPQVAEMLLRITGGKALPHEVVAQIVAKTDGVPLFVEELTKMVLESGFLQEVDGRYELTGPLPALAIPTTLQDALMARLDRLATVKTVAQLGATIGRQFPYELLQAVASLDEARVRQALQQLVEAELLYQRGMIPQATYTFKHALIQDAAYQSLLKSTRQQYHQRIAQVLETRFPDVVETQPELLAHHLTAAGLNVQAIPYWQRAGRRAYERSANLEAISHLSKGLEALTLLPDTPERTQHELLLQTALGPALMAAKGYAAPEVERTCVRARELCQQIGDTRQLFPVLVGLWNFSFVRGACQTACDVGEQLLTLAQSDQDRQRLLRAHAALGEILFHTGQLISARAHLEQGIALYDPVQHHSHAVQIPTVACLAYAAWALWHLGYAEQALQRSHEACTLAEELSHPLSLSIALDFTGHVHQFRREVQAARKHAEAAFAIAHEQGFPFWESSAMILRGWALALEGNSHEGMVQLREGLVAFRATGAEIQQPSWLALLAEAYGHVGQVDAGLRAVAEGLAVLQQTGERYYEAELYRLRGELLWQQPTRQKWLEAEQSLLQAVDVARQQQAKSWELRAAVSLSRLWQLQGKRTEVRELLASIYGWFTEGFATADLQEAKALLEELGG
jgi:TOMM system kinase/cyclase fusion protein